MPVKTGKAILDDSGKAILDDSGNAFVDDAQYVANGHRFGDLTAVFSGGAKVYSMRTGDDSRETVLTLGGTDYEEPQTVTLRIKTDGGVTSKTLTHDDGATTGEWYCDWTSDEIGALGEGTHRADVRATFLDGSQATFPTTGKLTIKILPII